MTKLDWSKANRPPRSQRKWDGPTRGTPKQRALIKALTKELGFTRRQKEALWKGIRDAEDASAAIDRLLAEKRRDRSPEASHMAAIRAEGE